MLQAQVPPVRLLAAVGLLLAHVAAGAGNVVAFDRERPRWTALEYSASKLFVSASARVEARIRPGAEIAGELRATPAGHPVPAGPEVLEMIYAARGFGRESLTTLWVDPASGGTLQRTQRDTGSRERLRTYRFTDVGAYHFTRWPATGDEEALPPEQWTSTSEGMRAWSAAAVGKPVTEATALLWMVAAADLSARGDRLEVLTFSRRHVNRVTIEAVGRRAIKVDFLERGPAGSRRHRGTVEAIVLRLRGSPLDPVAEDDEAFELLGLSGDLDIFLDPQTRAPLQLRGRIKIAGQTTVRLTGMATR